MSAGAGDALLRKSDQGVDGDLRSWLHVSSCTEILRADEGLGAVRNSRVNFADFLSSDEEGLRLPFFARRFVRFRSLCRVEPSRS
jgi:hypothetical protein